VVELFDGPGSLRHPTERLAFWLTLPLAIPAALVVAFVLHESIGASQVALFIVAAMIYVTLARGRLLGTSVQVHENQYPRVFAIVKRACAALDIPMPAIFVRDDNNVPVAALGFGDPYALVLSTKWIETFRDDELAFMIGKELGHIASGHTRYLSLLSVNGNENPLIAFVFGPWLRRCTYTCDKVGLLCCDSLDAAMRAISVANFHEFARAIDREIFAQQTAEINSDSVLRWGAWLGSEPYATTRIASLREFLASPSYEQAKAIFVQDAESEPPALAAPGTGTVQVRDCAGWWRRFAAFSIDAIVVAAIIGASGGDVVNVHVDKKAAAHRPGVTFSSNLNSIAGKPSHSPSPSPSPSASAAPDAVDVGPVVITNGSGVSVPSFDSFVDDVIDRSKSFSFFFYLAVYLALLVAVAGQTFGMTIAGLRVVTPDFKRPTVWRVIWRYVVVFFAWWLIAILSIFWRRILLHDRLSGTRVVKVERALARVAARTAE
jgi:Zn-dependent protease with chaperone function